MKIIVNYCYADHDTHFQGDCLETNIRVAGHPDYEDNMYVDLPFESEYPKELTETFINGMIFTYTGEVEVEEHKLAIIDLGD